MTTFDIDSTKKTKHLEVLESLVEQGHALQSTHNPQTWRLSALTFALHLNDCIILFQQLKDKWAKRLPFSEAWDVDFTEWKTRIWSLVNNVSSFTEESQYGNWQRLCERDYHTFIVKASDCLSGELPLQDLTDFLLEKNTGLKKVIIDSGQDLSTLFADTESMLYSTSSELYEQFYKDLANIYMKETINPYQIDENGLPVTYERWKASKSKKRLPELLISKIKAANTAMLDIKFWKETWSECFDIDNRYIDKDGFARYIFQHRKRIIESKQYPCKNCLGRCFATLCLCEHLWQEQYLLLHPENITNRLDMDDEQQKEEEDNSSLSEARQSKLDEIIGILQNGNWKLPATKEKIVLLLNAVFGKDLSSLDKEDIPMCEKMWEYAEGGGRSGTMIVPANLAGFFKEENLLQGTPLEISNALFGKSNNQVNNINKGKGTPGNCSNAFLAVIPFIRKYINKNIRKE